MFSSRISIPDWDNRSRPNGRSHGKLTRRRRTPGSKPSSPLVEVWRGGRSARGCAVARQGGNHRAGPTGLDDATGKHGFRHYFVGSRGSGARQHLKFSSTLAHTYGRVSALMLNQLRRELVHLRQYHQRYIAPRTHVGMVLPMEAVGRGTLSSHRMMKRQLRLMSSIDQGGARGRERAFPVRP